METITFYSYKGGSGRSLLLANAARYLALAGKKVVALDLDFEAPGLHYKLHIGRPGERTGDVVPQRGVVDYLLATQSGNGSVSPTTFITNVPLPPGAPGQLHLMPAGSAPSAEYWRALTTLSRHELLGDPEGEAPVAAFLELKTLIEEELEADALLIDARTGITELGGIATTILADKVVCLLLDNSESLTGARAVIRSLGRAPRLRDQAPIEVIPVLSRVSEPDEEVEERILAFLNEEPPPTSRRLLLTASSSCVTTATLRRKSVCTSEKTRRRSQALRTSLASATTRGPTRQLASAETMPS